MPSQNSWNQIFFCIQILQATGHSSATAVLRYCIKKELDQINIEGTRETFGVTRLKSIEGTAIYEGKKNEVIVMKDLQESLRLRMYNFNDFFFNRKRMNF